jgi:hypothetical protein
MLDFDYFGTAKSEISFLQSNPFSLIERYDADADVLRNPVSVPAWKEWE